MVADSDHPELPSDIVDLERTLTYSVYCDRCGYNLRYQRFVGRCPECGGEYNARSTKMEGIYTARDNSFPVGAIFMTLVCLGLGVLMVIGGINPVSDWVLLGGAGFFIVGAMYTKLAYRGVTRYLRYRFIQRRVDADDEAEFE
jgi:hypothetical protein